MAWEEDKSDVSDVVSYFCISILQLQRRLTVCEKDLWCSMRGFSTFPKFLHKHLSQNNIILSLEYCTKYYSYSIRLGLHVSINRNQKMPSKLFENLKYTKIKLTKFHHHENEWPLCVVLQSPFLEIQSTFQKRKQSNSA